MDKGLLDNSKESVGNKYLGNEALQKKNLCLEDVRQGVVWSQILDKPRSKNPYFLKLHSR